MPYSFPPYVKQQVHERIASGQYASEDDVLRDALSALTWEEQETAAVREALDALDAGDEGVPLVKTFASIHRRT